MPFASKFVHHGLEARIIKTFAEREIEVHAQAAHKFRRTALATARSSRARSQVFLVAALEFDQFLPRLLPGLLDSLRRRR